MGATTIAWGNLWDRVASETAADFGRPGWLLNACLDSCEVVLLRQVVLLRRLSRAEAQHMTQGLLQIRLALVRRYVARWRQAHRGRPRRLTR
jgi:hypothetical protein